MKKYFVVRYVVDQDEGFIDTKAVFESGAEALDYVKHHVDSDYERNRYMIEILSGEKYIGTINPGDLNITFDDVYGIATCLVASVNNLLDVNPMFKVDKNLYTKYNEAKKIITRYKNIFE